MTQFLFNLQTVAPVFLIAFLGIFLRQIKLMTENGIEATSRLVFNVALPSLVFLKLSTVNLNELFSLQQLFFGYMGTIGLFILLWVIAHFTIHKAENKSVLIQGSLRSNYAIVGFAILLNRFGEPTLIKASFLLVTIMPLYNILSVIILSLYNKESKSISLKKILLSIITNPLLLAALLSVPFSLLQIKIPAMFLRTLDALAGLALPLALLGIGASLHWDTLKQCSHLAIFATIVKIILFPAIMAIWMAYSGIKGDDMAVLFLLFASPTSIASFIMAREMGGNSRLAGNIVLISTLLSSITIAFGLYLLELAGLIS